MDARQPACLEVGQRLKLDGKTWTVAKLGKEIRLERQGGREVMYRHSRTLEKLVGAVA